MSDSICLNCPMNGSMDCVYCSHSDYEERYGEDGDRDWLEDFDPPEAEIE